MNTPTHTNIYKLKTVMNLLKTGKPATLEVCSLDHRRPEKSGKRLHLVNVVLTSHKGFLDATAYYPNGQSVSFHPIHIETFNGKTVTP